jgi:hypothetical protein
VYAHAFARIININTEKIASSGDTDSSSSSQDGNVNSNKKCEKSVLKGYTGDSGCFNCFLKDWDAEIDKLEHV